MCVIVTYGVQCLVVGCRGSGAGEQAVRPGKGMLHKCSIPLPGCLFFYAYATTHGQTHIKFTQTRISLNTKAASQIRTILTFVKTNENA